MNNKLFELENSNIADKDLLKGHRQRQRDKFLQSYISGHNPMHDYEILELILFTAIPRKDVKNIAKKLLHEFNDIERVITASPQELSKFPELNQIAITSIKIAEEMALRLLKKRITRKYILSSHKAVTDYLMASMAYKKIEQFRILFLDNKNRLIADEIQQEGTINKTALYPREVIKRCLELHASSIIMVHNHPSGDCSPSKADIKLTNSLMQITILLDIEIHDHIIIATENFFSFRDNGLL